MLKILLQLIQVVLQFLMTNKKQPVIEQPDMDEEENDPKEENEEEQDYNIKIQQIKKPEFEILSHPSPNFKKYNKKVNEIIVLHHTAGASLHGDLAWMCNPESKVSAHYLLGRDGSIIQLVNDNDVAWHAGKSYYEGKDNVNLFSIGIELQGNTCLHKLTKFQYDSLVWLVKQLMVKYNIPAGKVVDHRFIAPGRKLDLDPKNFDWEQFYTDIE